MPPTTSIRDFTSTDTEKLWSVLERSLAAYGLRTDSCNTDTDLMDVQANYIERGGRFRVLTLDNTAIGMCGLYIISGERVELRKMYLEPTHKGQGYGKLLLNDALGLARQAGFKTMTLETNRLLVEAIAMYRKFGFTDVERDNLTARCDRAMIREL